MSDLEAFLVSSAFPVAFFVVLAIGLAIGAAIHRRRRERDAVRRRAFEALYDVDAFSFRGSRKVLEAALLQCHKEIGRVYIESDMRAGVVRVVLRRHDGGFVSPQALAVAQAAAERVSPDYVLVTVSTA